MNARARILGLGSPFGDDRVGWAAVEAIRSSAWYRECPEAVELVLLDRPGATVLAAMREASHVLILDAMRTGVRPGAIRRLGAAEIADAAPRLVSGHGFGLREALSLGAALGLLPPRLTIFA